MKSRIFFLQSIWILMIFISCKKEINFPSPVASLTIVNASPDNANIIVATSDTIIPYYKYLVPISYGSYGEYGYTQGKVPLMIISSADTTTPLLQAKLDMKAGEIYSLFIAGQFKALDTVYVKESLPVYTDSVEGVRFINLSQGSQPMSVNLEGNDPSQKEFDGLGYKQISTFKPYLFNSTVSYYSFEIRDQVTGNLLMTYPWAGKLFASNTIVISGSEDPANPNPLQAFLVNHY